MIALRSLPIVRNYVMSDAKQPESASGERDALMVPHVESYPEVIVARNLPSENLVRSILIFVAMVPAALVVLLSLQLGARSGSDMYSSSELALYLGIILAIIVISVTVLRISISRFRNPTVTIPQNDRKLLEELIRNENTKAIELYVRLASLGGPTGTATKLGLTGLPLATIGLTLFFSIVAIFVPTGFLDLAKLTLGAFIGSFVQRSGEAIERAVRANSSMAAAVSQPQSQTSSSAHGVPGT
jgi:hypothetical protein